MLQTKHHIGRAADLSDASLDLWKSIRIWCEGITDGSIPKNSSFFLITTSRSPGGSAAHYLSTGVDRNPPRAVERLKATVASSTNQANEPAYAAFRRLNDVDKLTLVESIWIIDSAPVITDLDSELRREVYFAAPKQYTDSFLQRLEGWWLRRVINHLAEGSSTPILSQELEKETARLREQFKQDNLPIDDDILSETVDASGYQDRKFVQQLRLIEVGNKRIFYAIQNYFRAFMQRSRWVREDLLLVGELDRYERA